MFALGLFIGILIGGILGMWNTKRAFEKVMKNPEKYK